ncbi:hypothetical protein [Novosphingobium sp. SG720]|uniref:hypothetical protein n=1 Tax=Novosphingobium sp. SG720 TaxID=2586998 RepID=UPI00144505D4|nr:hypothetical protein [Novosphingobium sp. SG720]NKJ43163.1 hypothetical protein [Novosphingobium sp. SG720]
MTKRREPLTYEATLTDVAAVIGWDQCGAICGVSGRAVRLWSDHDCETEIRMIDAERLDRAFLERGGGYAPFHRLMALRLDVAAHDVAGHSLSEIAMGAAKEAGEAVAALIKASGQPDNPAARREATKEVQEAIDTLTDGLAAIKRTETGGNQ